MGMKPTIHEFGQGPPQQSAQESSSQRVQHFQMDSEYMHRA